MEQQDLLALIDKYLNGTANEEERYLLQQYFSRFQQTDTWNEADLGDRDETETRILNRLSAAIRQQPPAAVVPFYGRSWMKIAGVVLCLAAGVVTWWQGSKGKTEPIARKEQPQVIVSTVQNHSNTTLTLPDGTVMVLDSSPNGLLVRHNNTIIRKQGNHITVNPGVPSKNKTAVANGIHTLKTPNGRQFKAVLADGSQVWLNAASSLRFPTVFAGNERRVEISGEAYFEVAKDAARPFRVLTVVPDTPGHKETLVEVLGTHFNINAYGDDGGMKTTLLEGSVKVAVAKTGNSATAQETVLVPGEQARVTSLQTVAITKADTEEAVAWKSNLFYFNNTGLQNIMQQLARWYNVEVVYAGEVPVRHFSGKISRAAPLSTVLEILEQSNIHFTIRGKQIIVKS